LVADPDEFSDVPEEDDASDGVVLVPEPDELSEPGGVWVLAPEPDELSEAGGE
jgi:hypothetical protein